MDFNVYISIIFAILVASLLGALFNIITQSFSSRKKIKLVIILVIITFILILFASLIYFHDIIYNNLPSLLNYDLGKLKILPFHKEEFDDLSFRSVFNINIWISLIIYFFAYHIIYTRKTQKKYHLYLLWIIVFCYIVVPIRFWTIYNTCKILYNFPIPIRYVLQSIFYSIITYNEIKFIDFYCYNKLHEKFSHKKT